MARWHFSPLGWGVLAIALLAAYVPYSSVLGWLYTSWSLQPEYSHGILVPLLSLFLLWRERDALARSQFTGSWLGLALVAGGVVLWYVSELSTIYVIGQYAFLLELYGLVLSLVGPAVFRRITMPLLILIFMIPFPAFFTNTLSLKLQLLSSQLGVDVVRLFGISVYLEGNVIDLGTLKLQVVEACSGLRYLFPLMTLAFLIAYLYRAPFWKRSLLFLSSIPITVLMNSLRIGLIGVTVEYWGREMAEGLLHDFEGWVVFMCCTAVLLVVAAVLTRIGSPNARLRDALILDWGPAPPKAAPSQTRSLPPAFLAALAVAAVIVIASFAMPERVEVRPSRVSLSEFPARLESWEGQRSKLEDVYLEALNLDDYLLADFRKPSGLPVNLWIAYYESQRKGRSTHSPKSCLPGGGWEFRSLAPHRVEIPGGAPITVNRGVIESNGQRELMYYWFQQRGRIVTNEYLVKWFLFEDAMTRNRTDGALVRLMVPIPSGASEADSDRELTRFTGLLTQQLSRYVPD